MRAVCVITVSFITVCLLSANVQAADPVARTNDLVNAFKAVKPPPEDGSDLSAADRKANSAAFAALDAFFNYDRLTAEPIAPHKSKLDAKQLEQFNTQFRELIRLVAYPNSGSFLQKAELKLKAGKRKGKKVDVNLDAFLAEEDFETTVTFHWEESDGNLRIIDVSFDKSSLINDYRNQFSRIIAKDGVKGLLDKMQRRLKKEREESIL